MNNRFHKLNYLKTSTIEEVKHFSTLTTTMADLPKDELTTFPYFSRGEVEFAGEWQYPHFDYSLNYLGFRNESIPIEYFL